MKTIQCPSCGFNVPSGVPMCPECYLPVSLVAFPFKGSSKISDNIHSSISTAFFYNALQCKEYASHDPSKFPLFQHVMYAWPVAVASSLFSLAGFADNDDIQVYLEDESKFSVLQVSRFSILADNNPEAWLKVEHRFSREFLLTELFT